MKQLLAILFFIAPQLIFAQKTDISYPDYDIIIDHFFEKYSPQLINSQYLRFHKKPDGWHVIVTDYSDGQQIVKNEMLWSKKENTFKGIDFEKAFSENNIEQYIKKFKRDWDYRFYKISPYYGYTAWDKDVINDFEDATELSDTTLYALGRAYSSYASNLLNNNTGYADSASIFNIPYGRNSLSEEQLSKYRFYRHKAIEKFNALNKQSPDFETIVGKIAIKKANEHMTSFLDLMIYQNEEEARKELKPDLYPGLFSATAKNYLNSCAPNAILFTQGDNDTYPLLYVQAMEDFRTDVTVVNISLLATSRYAELLKNKIFNAPGLPISFSPEQLKSKYTEWAMIINSNKTAIDLSEVVNTFKNEKKLQESQRIKFYQVPGYLTIKEDNDSITWKRKGYMFRSEILLYDILVHNRWERPVYFSYSFDKRTYEDLVNYWQLEGLTYRLTSNGKEKNPSNTGLINSELMFKNVTTKFDWESIKSCSDNNRSILNTYRNLISELAVALIEKQESAKAEIVLDKVIDAIPDSKLLFDYYTLPIIRAYLELKQDEKAVKIARQFIYNCNLDLFNWPNYTTEEKKQLIAYTKNELLRIAKEFEQKEIIEMLSN